MTSTVCPPIWQKRNDPSRSLAAVTTFRIAEWAFAGWFREGTTFATSWYRQSYRAPIRRPSSMAPSFNQSRRSDGPSEGPGCFPRTRLNLLLSFGGWRSESWADQLPRLLDPVGIHSIKVETGRQAEDIIRSTPVHIAVIDLRIPLEMKVESQRVEAAGPRILQLLRRLHPAPPTIVVREAQPVERERSRGLAAALREGAYSVLDHPVRLETMLELLRRIARRYYADLWPV